MALTRPREAALIQAATRLFLERGFHATSMQDLADSLGMNRGSLYHYIDSKDDLLWSIVSDALEQLRRQVGPVLETDAPPDERLRAAILAHLAVASTEQQALSLLQVELRALPPARRDELIARRDAYEALWRATVAQGVAEGTFRPVDVRLATITILAACNWFTQWYRPGGSLSAEQIGLSVADLMLHGLAATLSAGGGRGSRNANREVHE